MEHFEVLEIKEEITDQDVDPSMEFEDMSSQLMEESLTHKDTPATKLATEHAFKKFYRFLQIKGKDKTLLVEYIAVPVDPLVVTELDHCLQSFFASVRRLDGDYVKKNTLFSLKYGLRRYYEKLFDIGDKNKFPEWNHMFKSMLKHLKNHGKGDTDHMQPVSAGDLRKCREYFMRNIHVPRTLQEYVWFITTLAFGLRGRENQRRMTKDSLTMAYDANGRKFLHLSEEEPPPGDGTGLNKPRNGILYEEPGNPLCPIACYQNYLAHLTSEESLYQKAKDTLIPHDKVWYERRPVGKNMLSKMMPNISRKAGCSQLYTSHALRSTKDEDYPMFRHQGVQLVAPPGGGMPTTAVIMPQNGAITVSGGIIPARGGIICANGSMPANIRIIPASGSMPLSGGIIPPAAAGGPGGNTSFSTATWQPIVSNSNPNCGPSPGADIYTRSAHTCGMFPENSSGSHHRSEANIQNSGDSYSGHTSSGGTHPHNGGQHPNIAGMHPNGTGTRPNPSDSHTQYNIQNPGSGVPQQAPQTSKPLQWAIHQEPISKSDLNLLHVYFKGWSQSAVVLQHKIFVDTMLNFGSKVWQNIEQLKKGDFAVNTDASGLSYLYECQGEHYANAGSTVNRVYERRGIESCPVKSFIYYMQRLSPDGSALFQRPKNAHTSDQSIWYDSQAVGQCMLGNMMGAISEAAGLSKKYTKHSLKATSLSETSDLLYCCDESGSVLQGQIARGVASHASQGGRPSGGEISHQLQPVAAAVSSGPAQQKDDLSDDDSDDTLTFNDRKASSTLLQELHKLQSNRELCDVHLLLPNGTSIQMHRVVLAAHSPYFKTLIQKSLASDPSTLPLIPVETDASIMNILVRYMYSGKLTLPIHSVDKLRSAAQKYSLHKLSYFSDLFRSQTDTNEATPPPISTGSSSMGAPISTQSPTVGAPSQQGHTVSQPVTMKPSERNTVASSQHTLSQPVQMRPSENIAVTTAPSIGRQGPIIQSVQTISPSTCRGQQVGSGGSSAEHTLKRTRASASGVNVSKGIAPSTLPKFIIQVQPPQNIVPSQTESQSEPTHRTRSTTKKPIENTSIVVKDLSGKGTSFRPIIPKPPVVVGTAGCGTSQYGKISSVWSKSSSGNQTATPAVHDLQGGRFILVPVSQPQMPRPLPTCLETTSTVSHSQTTPPAANQKDMDFLFPNEQDHQKEQVEDFVVKIERDSDDSEEDDNSQEQDDSLLYLECSDSDNSWVCQDNSRSSSSSPGSAGQEELNDESGKRPNQSDEEHSSSKKIKTEDKQDK